MKAIVRRTYGPPDVLHLEEVPLPIPRDGDVLVGAGEMFVIPKGTEHKTSAQSECRAMLVELAGTVNTGDLVDQKTGAVDQWI